MARKAAPSFISRAGIARLADLSVDEVRALYDANELPMPDAFHVDMDLARPLWLFETIEPWIRARWPDDDDDDRSAGEKLASPPPIDDLGYDEALRHRPLPPGRSEMAPEEWDALIAEAPGLVSTTDATGVTRLWPNGPPEEDPPWEPSRPKDD